MHNMHTSIARVATPRTAPQAVGLAFTHGHRKTNSSAQQPREDRGPPSGGPLPHTVGPSGPTFPSKARPGRRRAAGLHHTHQSRGMFGPPERAAIVSLLRHSHGMGAPDRSACGLCAQRGGLAPLLSGPRLLSGYQRMIRAGTVLAKSFKHAQSERRGGARHALPPRGQ